MLFKVKILRWRGATWLDGDEDLGWLVAAGIREDGSRTDFYEALASQARSERARHNASHGGELKTDTYVEAWLPVELDHKRYAAEAGLRLHDHLRDVIRSLVRASLLDGYEHQGSIGGATIGILVRAEAGHETYVAVRVTGSVPPNIVAVVLDLVPGCDRDGWGFEITMPDRSLRPGEEVWSNIMDPTEAEKVIDD